MNYGGTASHMAAHSVPNGRSGHRRREFLVLCLCISLLYLNLIRLGLGVWPQTATALAAPAEPSQAQPTTLTQTYAAANSAGSTEAVAAASTANISGCTSSGYALPTPIDLANAAPGLTTIVETPTRYTLHANDTPTLKAQIAQCPYRQTVGTYQAYTSYQLSWRYQTQVVAPDMCRLTNVKVGLHINQFMPALVSTNATLNVQWATYDDALRYHESGHVTIDTRYARQLTDNLTSLGAMRCASLDTQARFAINTQLTLLNAANELYDAQTDHGTTQGATL